MSSRTLTEKPAQPQQESLSGIARAREQKPQARQTLHGYAEGFGADPVQAPATSGSVHNFRLVPVYPNARAGGGVLQAKLTVNAPGDVYEQEADSIADKIMRAPASKLQRSCACGGECSKCQTKHPEKDEILQTKRVPSTNAAESVAPDIAHAALQSSGQPLSSATTSLFEPRFGHDFSRVRVHTDARADAGARAVNAHAYTVGHDIVFAAGRYAPHTHEGQRLIAHELTHVVQQSSHSQAHLQRDLAIEPVVANPVDRTLSEADIRAAIEFNRTRFKDPYSLAVIRDVIGVPRFPAVSDRDLALGVGRWQSQHGIAQDGQLGAVTTTYVIEELQAEGNDADAALLMLEFPRGTFLDIDTTFCQCRQRLEREISEATFFIAEYQACGAEAGVRTGAQVENCINQRARARGQRLVTAGTTAPSGQISVAATGGPCGPLVDRLTTAHEQIHSVHTGELQQAFGAGTAAFTRAFNAAPDWVQDEVNSRHTDIAVSQWALAILTRICPP